MYSISDEQDKISLTGPMENVNNMLHSISVAQINIVTND